MSIVAVHGPNTMGSQALLEVGPAQAVLQPLTPTDGLKWTFRLDAPSTRTTSLAWTFPTGTPASATGPGPHNVTFASAGTKAVTAVATGVGEGANPYPPAGTTNIPVTAVSGAVPGLLMAGEEESQEGSPPEEESTSTFEVEEEEVAFDPGEHTVDEVKAYIEANPDEAYQVYGQELNGKNRATLVSWLEAQIPFDPSEYTVQEVLEYAEDNPDELEDILAAEKTGKDRSTLVSQLEALRSV